MTKTDTAGAAVAPTQIASSKGPRGDIFVKNEHTGSGFRTIALALAGPRASQ